MLDKRPKTRGECERRGRPCAYISCRHHLAPDKLRLSILDESKSADEVADEVLAMRHTCSLDLADEGGIMPTKLAGLMDMTSAGVDAIIRGAAPAIKKGLEVRGYSFDLLFTDEVGRGVDPTAHAMRVNAPPYPVKIKERAISIYHRRTRADAVAFVELATGRKCNGNLIRDWAKRADKKKRKAGPWSSLRFPLTTVRKAILLYRAERKAGTKTRAAAERVSRQLKVSVSQATLIKWDRAAREHGLP